MIEFLHPVNIRIEILVDGRIVGNGLGIGLLLGIERHVVGNLGIHDILVRVVDTPAGMLVSLIDGLHVLYAIHEVRNLGELCHTLVEVNGEFRFANDTGLRCDDDDTVTATHTIDSRGGRILEDCDGLNVLRVELTEASLYAIDKHQGSLVAVGQRGQAANPDIRVVLSRKTCTLDGHHTGHTAGKHRTEVGYRRLDMFHLQRGLRAKHRHLFRCRIAGDDDLIEFSHILVHNHIAQGSMHFRLQRLETNVLSRENRMSTLAGYGIVAIDISDGRDIRTFFLNGHSYQHLTIGIDDTSRDLQRSGGKCRNAKKQGQHQAGPLYFMLDCNSHYYRYNG